MYGRRPVIALLTYPERAACVAVVIDSREGSVASCSVSTPRPEVGEEVAIALALTATPATAIISASQTVLRNFATGRVSPITARILQTEPNPPAHCSRPIWTPAHSSLPGDELEGCLSAAGMPRMLHLEREGGIA
ncbi:hypothetical protein HPB48_005746 [Haemaphysalis longicornis]|uniref:Uncharacterized protein n=1 Tax=Haemaphysalis longicornis TaxID=44386 RepID=A0A9J6F6U4_HAELO|nr:hypothetical protein HPB48_005746 [Haemaphysalis longicornis]